MQTKEEIELVKNRLWETLKNRNDVNGVGIEHNFKKWFFCLYVDNNADLNSLPKKFEGYEIKIYLSNSFEFLTIKKNKFYIRILNMIKNIFKI